MNLFSMDDKNKANSFEYLIEYRKKSVKKTANVMESK